MLYPTHAVHRAVLASTPGAMGLWDAWDAVALAAMAAALVACGIVGALVIWHRASPHVKTISPQSVLFEAVAGMVWVVGTALSGSHFHRDFSCEVWLLWLAWLGEAGFVAAVLHRMGMLASVFYANPGALPWLWTIPLATNMVCCLYVDLGSFVKDATPGMDADGTDCVLLPEGVHIMMHAALLQLATTLAMIQGLRSVPPAFRYTGQMVALVCWGLVVCFIGIGLRLASSPLQDAFLTTAVSCTVVLVLTLHIQVAVRRAWRDEPFSLDVALNIKHERRMAMANFQAFVLRCAPRHVDVFRLAWRLWKISCGGTAAGGSIGTSITALYRMLELEPCKNFTVHSASMSPDHAEAKAPLFVVRTPAHMHMTRRSYMGTPMHTQGTETGVPPRPPSTSSWMPDVSLQVDVGTQEQKWSRSSSSHSSNGSRVDTPKPHTSSGHTLLFAATPSLGGAQLPRGSVDLPEAPRGVRHSAKECVVQNAAAYAPGLPLADLFDAMDGAGTEASKTRPMADIVATGHVRSSASASRRRTLYVERLPELLETSLSTFLDVLRKDPSRANISNRTFVLRLVTYVLLRVGCLYDAVWMPRCAAAMAIRKHMAEEWKVRLYRRMGVWEATVDEFGRMRETPDPASFFHTLFPFVQPVGYDTLRVDPTQK